MTNHDDDLLDLESDFENGFEVGFKAAQQMALDIVQSGYYAHIFNIETVMNKIRDMDPYIVE